MREEIYFTLLKLTCLLKNRCTLQVRRWSFLNRGIVMWQIVSTIWEMLKTYCLGQHLNFMTRDSSPREVHYPIDEKYRCYVCKKQRQSTIPVGERLLIVWIFKNYTTIRGFLMMNVYFAIKWNMGIWYACEEDYRIGVYRRSRLRSSTNKGRVIALRRRISKNWFNSRE
jgi:hypothetical protein